MFGSGEWGELLPSLPGLPSPPPIGGPSIGRSFRALAGSKPPQVVSLANPLLGLVGVRAKQGLSLVFKASNALLLLLFS